MPTYTVKNKEGTEWDIFCSHKELVEKCEKDELQQVYRALNIISSQEGDTRKKAGGEWNDLLKKVKKGSGRVNTIKT
jgi:hypothetical protein|tara:strand:+ start:383 stop:613 length:231 start_codon:yes stop_codon:yes gene_type:complete